MSNQIVTPKTRIEIVIDNQTGETSAEMKEGNMAAISMIGIYSQLITGLAQMIIKEQLAAATIAKPQAVIPSIKGKVNNHG